MIIELGGLGPAGNAAQMTVCSQRMSWELRNEATGVFNAPIRAEHFEMK